MLPVNLGLIAFIGWALAREVSTGKNVTSQLTDLQKEIASLESQNGDYTGLIARLGTNSFVEREARLKLGYQKPGEQTLILQDPSADTVNAAVLTQHTVPTTNPGKWWAYFFE